MNRKTTKRALGLSFVSLLLCFTMLMGTTFAWFTDNATVSANKIQAGTLDIKLYQIEPQNSYGNEEEWVWTDITENADPIINYQKWEPGYVQAVNLRIENVGNLAAKIKVNLVATSDFTKLADVIDVYMSYGPFVKTDRDYWINENQKIGTLREVVDRQLGLNIPTNAEDVIRPQEVAGVRDGLSECYACFALKMQESAGNEYQNMELGTFDIRVSAAQATYESDSFDDQYDANAEYDKIEIFDEWDGSAGAEAEPPAAENDGTILINSAAEFAAFAKDVNGGNTYEGKTVKLNTGIDMDNHTEWVPMTSFAGTFDGQDHTIKNLTKNLFGTVSGTVKNLNVKGVTVHNTAKGGANGFIGTVAEGGLVDACKVSDVSITWDAGKGTTDCWGGIISRVNAGAEVKDSTFTNIRVTADRYVKRSSAVFAEVGGDISGCIVDGVTLTIADNYSGDAYTSQVGGVIADLYDGAEISDCKFNNVTVTVDEGFNTAGIIGKVGVGVGSSVGNTLTNIEVNNLKVTAGNTSVTYAAFSNIGGFIGQVDYRSATAEFKMDNCHINGLDMTVASNNAKEDPSAGFISSLNGHANITNCSVDGKINGTNEPVGIGGFLGAVGGYGAPATGYTVNITGCAADVAITGNDSIFVGGFVGHAGSYTKTMTLTLSFTNCEAKGSFYGVLDSNETCTFTGCKVDGAAFNG